MIQKYTFTGGGGWLDQVGLKLTQSPAKAGVEVRTELCKNSACSAEMNLAGGS